MSSVCRECRDDLEHCHGTVIIHALSAVECTDDCATPESVHAFRIDCDAVGCVCTVTVSASAAS
jgi:hypothetical protein